MNMIARFDSCTIVRRLNKGQKSLQLTATARHSPGVFSKYIEITNPRNDSVIEDSSELSQVPANEAEIVAEMLEVVTSLTCQSWIVGQVNVGFFVLVQFVTVLDGEQSIGSHENTCVAIR